ncbi:MAG TPA: hypothetical protein VFX50_04885 [Gemmatimonadales bacterium]|nr:hypothetical protein [Gemmatimonadales bacterium]
MQRTMTKFATFAAVGILAACGSDSNGSGSDAPVVSLSLAASPASAAAGLASLAEPYIITDGSNTLQIDKVELVAREIELKRADRDVVCGEDDSNTDDDSNDDSSDDASSDDCEEVEFGPVILDVPLGAGPARAFTVTVAPGSYDELEFEIHKPESSDDAAFIAANPDFEGVSVRVTGAWNGEPFTFTSDLDVEQEQDLVPPLTVELSGSTNVTLFVDLGVWFRDEGGALIDPRLANKGETYEGRVKSNIETSLNAFEDADEDGEDD